MVRVGMRSISAGIVALAMGFAIKSGMPAGPADAGAQIERPGISVFGKVHPEISDLRAPVGSRIPAGPGVRVASLENEVAAAWTRHHASFDERFASSFARPAEEDESGVFDDLLSPVPLAGTWRAPLGTFASPARLPANRLLRPDRAKHETAPPAVGQPAPESATVTRPPLPAAFNKAVRTAEPRNDSISLPDADRRTAIYDIAAHAVYLPNGEKLEAHSGLGSHMDDPRSVRIKRQGPTPPNVYDLVLREQLFHGVRAIRLVPADDGKMFGRDGMLAHTYMLGPNGQSNGCVSFKNYPAFLKAYLRGEVDRLVVVERLATASSRRAGL